LNNLKKRELSPLTRIVSNIPIVGGLLDRVIRQPLVRRGIDELKLALKYRQLFPNSVRLPNSGSPIFVDRSDSRGRGVLLCGASGQPNLKALWHRAIAKLEPDVVVDVGANYGEFVFGERYPTARRVIGIEANSALTPFLQKSHQQHPDRQKIMMLTALAAEHSDEEIEFFVDQGSSGRSTAVRRTDTVSVATRIRTVAIDDLLKDLPLEEMRLVFKIDVEGFEPVVFAGMQRLMERTGFLLGILEFNPALIRLSGVDPQVFLSDLHSRVQIVALPHRCPPQKLVEGTLAEIVRFEGSTDIELDLLVSSRKDSDSPERSLIDQVIGS
jgi:FkbM family methyltransferase